MGLALTFFGTPAVMFDGRSQPLACERRTQVLAYLALKRSWVARTELAALLWPELADKLASANLRKAIFRLQQLPWADRLQQQGGALRFDVETDVATFEAALQDQRVADAMALRSGNLLEGFDDGTSDAWTRWLNAERDRLRVTWRSAAVEFLQKDPESAQAIELATALLEADPLDDVALGALLTALVHSGQAGRARQAYRTFEQRLADELGVAPSAELQALHASMGTTQLSRAPSLPAAVRDEDFVGRTVELRRIEALLAQPECRLLTITGPGGVGKTRLAHRILSELGRAFADGAAFIALEDARTAQEIGGRVARELGVALSGRSQALDQVIEFLRARRVLLVLDNFEQLADDASPVQKMLTACAQLKVVVTSRVRLGLAGEWLLPLEGLPYPEPEDQEHADAFDAARLFIRAALRVSPAFQPQAEAAAIVRICQQVQGLPLALQMAAAWTRVLSCEAIADELTRGTQLLQASDGTHPARHSSIDAVFEQSWQLIAAAERDALARLSVFHGTFTPEAARAVAAAPLPVLASLVDKSLLHKEGARLHLHPLVRQLAAARLGDGETAASTQAAHADFFHRTMARLSLGVASGDGAALREMDEAFENCRRAWQWSVASGNPEQLAGSVSTLLNYCDHRGRIEEGLALLRQSIDSPATGLLHAQLLSKASHLEYRLDRYDDAEAHAQQALAAIGRGRDPATRVQALNVLGTCAYRRGRMTDAKRFFEQALAAAPPGDQARKRAITLDHLALIEKTLGHYPQALRLSLQSLVQHRSIGDRAGEALCLNNLASLQLVMQDFDAAAVHLREGLMICERDGLLATESLIRANLAEVSLKAGDLSAAEANAKRALQLAGGTGNRAVAAWARIKLAKIRLVDGQLDAARSALADGVGAAISLGIPTLKFDALACFSEILSAQGATPFARLVLNFAAGHPSASAAVRDELRRRMAPLPGDASVDANWPNIELDDLLNRIVVEAPQSYAPLIATLRATG